MRGINFTAWSHDEYAGEHARQSLDQLAGIGATAVALIATQYQSETTSSEVQADPERTPSDAALRAAIARAQANGMKVRLRVLVDVSTGAPRLEIAPADVDAWFASYRQRIAHYAELARSLSVDTLEIGAELKRLSGPANAARWRRLVAAARDRFAGELSYAANWDEFKQITWWDALDQIAIDAWFPLALDPGPSKDATVRAWTRFVGADGSAHRYLDALARTAARFRRPIVFSELGYTSSRGALVEPWRPGDGYSAEEQETGLQAAFEALTGRPWLEGIYLWHWSANPHAGGPGDTDHTVQRKPAEGVVRGWFTGPRAPDST